MTLLELKNALNNIEIHGGNHFRSNSKIVFQDKYGRQFQIEDVFVEFGEHALIALSEEKDSEQSCVGDYNDLPRFN